MICVIHLKDLIGEDAYPLDFISNFFIINNLCGNFACFEICANNQRRSKLLFFGCVKTKARIIVGRRDVKKIPHYAAVNQSCVFSMNFYELY